MGSDYLPLQLTLNNLQCNFLQSATPVHLSQNQNRLTPVIWNKDIIEGVNSVMSYPQVCQLKAPISIYSLLESNVGTLTEQIKFFELLYISYALTRDLHNLNRRKTSSVLIAGA